MNDEVDVKRMVCGLALAALAGLAQAQVYKCKQADGTTVFADAPCAVGAKPIEVAPASGPGRSDAARAEGARAGESAPGAARAPSFNEKADIAVRRRLLQNDIDVQERRIAATIDEMNAKLAELRNRKRFASNNLAGATWQNSLSEEMRAVAASYDTEINGMRDELARMRSERDRLPE